MTGQTPRKRRRDVGNGRGEKGSTTRRLASSETSSPKRLSRSARNDSTVPLVGSSSRSNEGVWTTPSHERSGQNGVKRMPKRGARFRQHAHLLPSTLSKIAMEQGHADDEFLPMSFDRSEARKGGATTRCGRMLHKSKCEEHGTMHDKIMLHGLMRGHQATQPRSRKTRSDNRHHFWNDSSQRRHVDLLGSRHAWHPSRKYLVSTHDVQSSNDCGSAVQSPTPCFSLPASSAQIQ